MHLYRVLKMFGTAILSFEWLEKKKKKIYRSGILWFYQLFDARAYFNL